jgi:Pectate lyase superfamily protein
MDTECVNTIYDLKALIPGSAPCIMVFGYHQPNDGGSGEFFWDKDSSELEDRGTIIKPDLLDSSKKGRWRRIIDESISVKWFGAKGNGLELDTDAMQNAIQAVKPGEELIIPNGRYKVKSLHIKSAISLQGIGKPTITSDNADSDPGDGGIHAVILINNGKIVDRNSNAYGGLEGDVRISDLEVEYTGKKPQSTGNTNLVEGIFARVERRFICENLEIHGAAHCGIYGFSSNSPLRPGQAKGCESI